ncbi:MAG: hypothetical protein IPK03_05455 [Bacteroidetes bacterium]|nr:hypothetical protein [Bacteroidota bacterium]
MNFKIVPFTASIDNSGNSSAVANQLSQIIAKETEMGYEYYSMESVETNVKPENGCFGFGAKPGYTTSVSVLVFKKK